MFTYTKERDLHNFIIDNFEHFFDFQFTSSEFVVNGGRVDIIGTDENTIYVIELKRDFISHKTVEQISKYLPEIRLLNPGKEVLGIAVAPNLEKGFSEDFLPPDISVKVMEGVEYIETPTTSTKKRVTFTLDEDLIKRLKAVSDESMIAQSKLVEKAVTEIVEEYEQRASQK